MFSVVSLVAIIEEINLAAISPSAMPLCLFGLDRSQVFGRIHNPNLVNASRLNWGLFQYFKIVYVIESYHDILDS